MANGEVGLSAALDNYRNLLWAALFLMITGSFAFTGLAIVTLYKDISRNALAINVLDRDMRDVKERQTKAISERDFIYKDIYRRIDDLQARAKK